MNCFSSRLVYLTRSGLAVAGLALLSACGGGGGGGENLIVSPPPATLPPVEKVVLEPDPAFSKHISLTNTAPAHAAGLTGEGIRIGVLDSGVNRNHPALVGRVLANLVYINPDQNNLSIDDVVGHGTAVSQIMAGEPFGSWPGGIAPGALIISARIINDERPEDDGSGKGNEVHGALGLKPIHQALIDRGVTIMNNSWGGLYWTDPGATAPIADEYRPFIIDNGGLVVFAAGNSGFDDPSSMAALPSQPGPGGSMPAADLEQGWLTVVALATDNPTELASYSNACGVAMNYCLAAPGKVVVTGTNDAPDEPSYFSYRGTSLSAPQVSGAAALVWEAFPYFDNDLVRQTLLGTATDLGTAGVDATFGYGLLNVGKAVQGPAQLDWGQVVADFDAITSTWSNAISGAGGITKRGSGQLDLTGQNSYAGPTRVEGGLLRSLYDLPSDALVLAQGTLMLDDASVLGTLRNAGTVAFSGGDASGADHVIGGSFEQTASGTFAFDVGSHVQVQGRADIDGTALVTGVTDGYVYAAREVFLDAAQGLFGTFDTLASVDGVFLDATLGYDSDSAWLDIQRLDVAATAQAMAMQPVALGSAHRVEAAFDLLDGHGEGDGAQFVDPDSAAAFTGAAAAIQRISSPVAAERTLASLSGELHAADAAFAMMAIQDRRHALESRLDVIDGGAIGAWASTLANRRGLGTQTQLDTRGWMLGHDLAFGEHLVLGATFGQSRGYAFSSLRGDRERNRQYDGQLYAAWSAGDNYVLGRLAFGRLDRWMLREIVLGNRSFGVDADYSSRYAVFGVQAGHRFDLGSGVLTPYVGIQALKFDREGFSEHGAAGFGLTAHDSGVRSTRALAGARLQRDWSMGPLDMALQARLEWQRTVRQSGGAIDARFTGLAAWSPISGAGPSSEAMVIGLGLLTTLPRGSRLQLDLDARREDGQTWTGARLRWAVGF